MTDEQLIKDILDYLRGWFVIVDRYGQLASAPFEDWYKEDLLRRIEAAIAKRGGKFVVGREQYTVRDGKIVVGMVT